ncbi:uncharacterized protein PAC_18407 [Phialocephala subalpina]|uniref:Uncharacterized protein n=1 Tax=Phialocephala subalpina TaxID=576137 RepID=A0A1L7XU23_9HELO|nr:uncharacterized protein PAC_18407 [Phialocephala subalpina]
MKVKVSTKFSSLLHDSAFVRGKYSHPVLRILLIITSQPMLKKRIRKWNLNRNLRQADMLRALSLALERGKVGKRSNFETKGRVLSSDDVKWWLKRKGVQNVEPLAVPDADANSQTTTDIRCYTPIPCESMLLTDPDESVPPPTRLTVRNPQVCSLALSTRRSPS